MKRMKKSILLGLAATLAAAGIAGCGAGDSEKTITMGGKNFTEGFLMAELYSLALEDAGFKVERQYGISTLTLNTAIQEGEIDVYPEYTGTGPVSYTHRDVYKRQVCVDFGRAWRGTAEPVCGQGCLPGDIGTEKGRK